MTDSKHGGNSMLYNYLEGLAILQNPSAKTIQVEEEKVSTFYPLPHSSSFYSRLKANLIFIAAIA